jgi:hypothetical protein
MSVLQQYDIYCEHGFKVIPLIEGMKRPMCKDWTKYDPDFNRMMIRKHPKCNLGLLLGEIVDVEGDTQHANELIDQLVGDYPHPVYISAKSRHHLFLNPFPGFRILKFEGIEFRADRHQSVMPPSTVKGVQYTWENGCWLDGIPKIPERLLAFFTKIKDKKHVVKPGHMRLYCGKCQEPCFIHKKRFDLELELFKQVKQKWQCHDCREFDLRESCRSLRKQRRHNDTFVGRQAG